jgi:DNA-binding protein H-NS
MAKSTQTAAKSEEPAAPNFSSHSLPELLEIKKSIESEIKSRQSREIEELRAKVAETASTFGLSVEQLMGLSTEGKRMTKHARGKQPAKYRGPAGEEWSGRGPAPRWMKPFLEKGKTKEDFLIK